MEPLENRTFTIHSCGISDCPPSWSWTTAENGFADYDLWAVFRGHGELTCGERKYAVSGGICLLLPPNRRVVATHDPADPLYTIHVHFGVSENDAPVFPYGAEARALPDPVFFRDLLGKVISLYYRSKSALADYWFTAAMTEFFMADTREADDKNQSGLFEKNIFYMCDLINEADAKAPTLGEFAKRYGYSEAYLGKLFRRTVGISFSAYVVSARMNKAKLLLRSSDISVGEIAEKLGYCDMCFFIKQFKNHVGVSPGKYRGSRR